MPATPNPQAVQVIEEFTELMLDTATAIVTRLSELTAQAEQNIKQRDADLARWEDEGGQCR